MLQEHYLEEGFEDASLSISDSKEQWDSDDPTESANQEEEDPLPHFTAYSAESYAEWS